MSDVKVRGEIDEGNRKLAEATKQQSAGGMAGLYAVNATFITPDGTPVHGRSAIEEMWKAQLGAGLKGVDLDTISVEDLSPDSYVEVGKYKVYVGDVTDSGRYMVVWKRGPAGKLELFLDIPVSHGA